MNSSGMHSRAYYPKALHTMGRAFDTAVDALPAHCKGLQGERRELALLIIRFFDAGVTNPAHLCKLALKVYTPPDTGARESSGFARSWLSISNPFPGSQWDCMAEERFHHATLPCR